VLTIKSSDGKSTVAEVRVGKSRTRVNFKTKPQGKLARSLAGKSKSWPAGGVVVTEANLATVRAGLLDDAGSTPRAERRAAAAKRVAAVAAGSRRKAGAAAVR